MRIVRGGIELRRLERRDLETVRSWRNEESIRLRMQFQNVISAASQVEWFESLHPENDWYFVAHEGVVPFGLFHIKQVQWALKTGEAGGFVSEARWARGVEAGLAILAVMDFGFFFLGLEYLEAAYNPAFTELDGLNRQLGYERVMLQENGFARARVSAARFLAATAAVRRASGTSTLYPGGHPPI
jgi:RimJ/RimL family protein N-acetyltransferase